MKKLVKLIIFILCFLPFIINVKAICNDKEINDFVEDLEVVFFAPSKEEDFSKEYLDKIGDQPDIEFSYFFIFNKDTYKGEGIEKVFEIEALDGKGVAGKWKYHESIGKYGVGGYNGINEEEYSWKIKVVSGECKGEVVKQSTYTVPQYNMYRNTKYCEKYPDHELCARFTDATKDMNDAQFGRAMAEYEKSINPQNEKFKDLILKYYGYVLCAVIPVILVSIYYRRRINRIIKLRNRDEDKHIRRKKVGLFLLGFFILLPNVFAESEECKVIVEQTMRLVQIPGVKISTRHCGWSGGGMFYLGQSKGDGSIDNALAVGREEVWSYPIDCQGNAAGPAILVKRCLTKSFNAATGSNDNGDGQVESAAKMSPSCTDTGNPCKTSVPAPCTIDTDADGIADSGCSKEVDGLECWGGGCKAYATSCSAKTFDGSASNWYDVGPTDDGESECVQALADAQKQAEAAASGDADCPRSDCSKTARLRCPGFGCPGWTTEERTPTTEEYEVNGTEVYCVNPGNKAGSSYKEITIDPNTCASSNSSVDCGYANILIEAKYFNDVASKEQGINYQIPDQIVSVATRLWGAYTNQGGYGSIGIGRFSGENCNIKQGDFTFGPGPIEGPCYEMVYIDPKGIASDHYDGSNVYTATVMEILKEFAGEYEKLGEFEIYETEKKFSDFNLKCDPNKNTLCGDKNIKYAMALFFNTRNGNDKMKDHANKMFGELSVRPMSIKISSQSYVQEVLGAGEENGTVEWEDCGDDCKISKSILSIDYNEDITHGSERIDCTQILAKQKRNEKLTEKEQMLINYCTVEVTQVRVYHGDNGDYTLYEEDGVRECNYNNECGPKKVIPGMISGVSQCQKSTCIVQTKVYADCTMDARKITTVIRYKGSKSIHGIKKYVACNTANPRVNEGIENQFFYQFKPVEKIEDVDVPPDELVEYDTPINCKADCEDISVKKSSKNCEKATMSGINSYRNMSEKQRADDMLKSYETSINDPSLSCILNASSMNKVTYDYSDYFGVNTDICRIYCSDSAHYYLPEKTILYAGMSVKYDIEYGTFKFDNDYNKYRKTNDSAKALTSIVEMRRDCVSEIYFDYLANGKSLGELMTKYGFDSSDVKFKTDDDGNYVLDDKGKLVEDGTTFGSVNTFMGLYYSVKKRLGRENKRNELLTQLIYDLYNCNLYTEMPVVKPKDNKIGPIYTNVIKKIYSDNYGFEGCELNNETNTCVGFEGMTYSAGAAYAVGSDAKIDGTQEVGDKKDTLQYKYTLELNKDDSAQVTNVKYCKGKGCFDYKSYFISDGDDTKRVDNNLAEGDYLLPHERIKSEHSHAYAASQKPVTYLGEDTTFIQYAGDSRTTSVEYYDNNKNDTTVVVPKNDYAYFTVSTKVGFYNVSTFEAEKYTGDVYDTTDGSPYKQKPTTTPENRVKLKEGLNPVNTKPRECSVIEGSKVGENYYDCATSYYMGETGTYFRNYGKGNGTAPKTVDRFYVAINNEEDTTFTCSYISKYLLDNDPQIVFRNIDLGDFFPEQSRKTQNGWMIGKNWLTGNAVSYRNQTEKYMETNGTLQYYNNHLEYSYTLDQNALKSVREDNEKMKNFTNNNLYSGFVNSNMYNGSMSSFIDELESGYNEYGIINNRLDEGSYKRGVSKYTQEKLNEKEEGN